VKRSAWPISLSTALVVLLLADMPGFSAQPVQSESGISENNKPDTVRIQNSSRQKNAEPVHVPNSRKSVVRDPSELPNSDETSMDGEQVQSPTYPAQTPHLYSSSGRVRSKGKIITGAALFGVSYGISVFAAASIQSDGNSSDSRQAGYFYIPVLGPIIADIAEPATGDAATPVALLCVGWSIAQGMGLALLITGLVGTPARPEVSSLPISIEPLVMKNKAGLTVRLRFNSL
jgi:hypothetical protein